MNINTNAEFHDCIPSLLAAQDALARLEARMEAASAPVREGVLARMALREAAGWLAHHGTWVHPLDLAMREAGLTGSYAAAGLGTRLPSVLPATARAGAQDGPPEDRDVAASLRLARHWRQLAELPTWLPPHLALPPNDGTPALLAAALLARDGAGQGRLTAQSVLAAACVWRARGGTGHPGLPLWSGPVQALHRLALAPRPAFPGAFLDIVAAAAIAARAELRRLETAELQAAKLPGTRRSRLHDAAAVALRRPVLTGRMLADALAISHRAAFDAIDRLAAAGVLREATGRRSWRGFIIAGESR